MNKLKKIIFYIILISLILFTMPLVVNARDGVENISHVGQVIYMTRNEYYSRDDIFCMEHGQIAALNGRYEVISNVKIEGMTSTDHTGKTITSKDNARFAYILSQENRDKINGVVANGIWNFGYTWMKNVGQYHAGLYDGFAGSKKGNETWVDQAAEDYGNELENGSKVVDNTNKNNIHTEPYEKDGKQYLRIGPFNWTFGGKITEINVYDQDSKPIQEKLYSSFLGTNENFFDANGIQSGKNFYISIPLDGKVSKITKIDGNIRMNVKSVNIWFLENVNSYNQNMIKIDPYETTDNIEISLDYNIALLGNLRVIKVNKDNTEVRLPGVGFYILNQELNKYVTQDESGKVSYVSKKDEATEFITDENGEISIKDLVVGTYVAYETKNPNYGYEMLTDGQVTEVKVEDTTNFQIENKQIYVKLSGIVWVDKISGKVSERNDLFRENDYDDADILLDGITVRLKDRTTGETVMETKTADGGAYLFQDVLIENLENYYIEFEYDGLTYTNVIPHLENEENGSKSAENSTVRDEFNKDFSTIEGATQNTGITLDENGNKVYDLNYNLDPNNHTATLINNGQYLITGNTDETGYSIRDNFTYGMEEIKWINQGLYEREQPDIALMKDLENVRVTVNGYEHVYNYSQRFVNQGEYGDGFNVGVKFGNKYGSTSYTRAIYKADYEYINEADSSKELKVYATYRIALRNESTNLITKINSIVDYYDSDYTLVKAGTQLDGNGQITGEELTHTDTNYNDEYSKTVINTNTRIEAQKQADIYVEFELNREQVVDLLNNEEVLDNVAEINSYSIFDGNGSVYAGIDKDSNPGNITPGDKATYQDDTDSAPGFKLEVADARTLSGKVFLDSTTGELMTGEIRQGDGKYEDGELGIQGVHITLTENTGSGKIYETDTNENGDFTISDFIPGDYTLTYTWGDQTYTVQNYKGTVYDKTRYDANTANKQWFKNDVDIRYTDATDDYSLRQQIDAEITGEITHSTDKNITIDKMNSTTPTMGIGVEYDSVYTASTGDKYTYSITNVDFGIVERARQRIDLNKRIDSLKVTLANGQLVIDAKFDGEGNVTGEANHLTYMGPSEMANPKNGYVRVELDNELIQGATLEVTYRINAMNSSELDYLTEEFYKYGITGGEVATLTPLEVVDYLDSDWAFNPERNQDWKVIQKEDLKNLVAEGVYVNEDTTINNKIILHTTKLAENALKPTESASVDLYVSKILSTSDELVFDNETEIIKLNKTGGGSKLVGIPGNYIPGSGKAEPDDSVAETVIVTPATGENLAFILPISIGVLALVILGIGIFFIKRKALK